MSLSLKLVSSPLNFAGEHEMVEAMFAAGLPCLHLRKPGMSGSELERWLLALDADVRGRVVVHGAPDLAVGMELAGCHMPLEWLVAGRHTLAEFGEVRAWSASLHSLEELRQCPAGVTDCFLSPVFDSISKPGYGAAFTFDELREGLFMARARSAQVPFIYALGGVDAENLGRVLDLGFDGAAVLGAVWNAPDPVGAWEELWRVAEDYGG
jgi:thiamine-phosphate pyrophosphorylase